LHSNVKPKQTYANGKDFFKYNCQAGKWQCHTGVGVSVKKKIIINVPANANMPPNNKCNNNSNNYKN